MCTSILDLALGYLDEKKEDENNLGKSSPKSPSSKTKMNQNNSVSTKAVGRKNGLFEILRLRVDDDKPLVRVKAIQTLGTALGLNYPRRKQRRSTSTCVSNSNNSSSKSRNSGKSSLVYQDDDRCADNGDYGKSNLNIYDVSLTESN